MHLGVGRHRAGARAAGEDPRSVGAWVLPPPPVQKVRLSFQITNKYLYLFLPSTRPLRETTCFCALDACPVALWLSPLGCRSTTAPQPRAIINPALTSPLIGLRHQPDTGIRKPFAFHLPSLSTHRGGSAQSVRLQSFCLSSLCAMQSAYARRGREGASSAEQAARRFRCTQ